MRNSSLSISDDERIQRGVSSAAENNSIVFLKVPLRWNQVISGGDDDGRLPERCMWDRHVFRAFTASAGSSTVRLAQREWWRASTAWLMKLNTLAIQKRSSMTPKIGWQLNVERHTNTLAERHASITGDGMTR